MFYFSNEGLVLGLPPQKAIKDMLCNVVRHIEMLYPSEQRERKMMAKDYNILQPTSTH